MDMNKYYNYMNIKHCIGVKLASINECICDDTKDSMRDAGDTFLSLKKDIEKLGDILLDIYINM